MKKGIFIMGILIPLFCTLLLVFSNADRKNQPAVPPVQNKPEAVKPPRPGSKVDWFEFKPIKNLSNPGWGDFLTDIENHLHPSLGTQYRHSDKDTWAHETTHGVHGWLNNNMQKERIHYFLYVGNNKAIKIKQPKFKISDVARLVPPSMQKSRYQLYLIQQQSGWNKEPVYLWDEWVAYGNGVQCGIELIKKDLYKPSQNDCCWGVLEFSVYATYVVIAQEKNDPDYDNKQMLEFLAWNLERSMNIYKEGQKLEKYNWDNGKYLKHLQTHEDAAVFRKFLADKFGKEWTKEVFGFE